MKKILILLLALVLVVSCKSLRKGKAGKPGVKGEVVTSVKNQNWVSERPIGMVPIPGGSFVLGQSDMDFNATGIKAPQTTVTVSSFYMDDTEITNAEYRQFINYVRDSVARTLLAEKAGSEGSDEGIGAYAYKSKKSDKEQSAYQQFLEQKGGRDGYENVGKELDWSVPLEWKTDRYPDVAYAEAIESMYYAPDERTNGERVLDTRKLTYKLTWIDQVDAVRKKERGRDLIKTEVIPVYPDTTVWIRDFNYSYNEPLFEQYFWHKAFAKYPVVGVNWNQARAFCAYSTKSKNDYNQSRKKKKEKVFEYRLPTEVEWEYAARGGLENAAYPWGGPYLIDDRGCYLANFKPKRGDYIEDPKKGTFMYTAPVKSFHKNGFGLYDMAGNVSEWTASAFNNSSYIISSTINPYIGNRVDEPKKVIKGGSWKDVGYMLMVGERDWEYKDSARSYIGFRRVQSIPEGVKVKYPPIKKYIE